ncbi:tRNA (adenosine(37)-N6)-threonylcarbamoyltransferase complex ATPase subunit type 1 TsaE [Pseudohongiella spirulinae]|uniref:tRNA threonylcarbamoyladenosine biosynthesis protein TsaE n=1 Tax=Pseudohongiella spirulinae TaxID=1249552 RepID=A0A0S2KGC2_9GAMM|nr:tRNA (adenosine(37)-N6)-threonylcarbamoyltransferase complex ATPase subunit type 1 TsaE [Pseudohongiella spirulinae]ALO47237.1 ADP-binding protein [Pseudohongiella spirulinae]
MSVGTHFLQDEYATEQFGAMLAKSLGRDGLIIFLQGDLGSGKTTLSRGLIRALGHKGAVKSPTYTLVEPYEDFDFPLYHFDLYRLSNPEEVDFLGVDEYFQPPAVCLIEWPQRGSGHLPAADLQLRLTDKGRGRQIEYQPLTHRGQAVVGRMQAMLL